MMINRASNIFLSLSLTVSSLSWGGDATPYSADTSTHHTSSHSHQMASQIAQRQDALREAMQQLQEGRNAYSAGRYTQAEESYRKALELLPKAEATRGQRDFMEKSLADALLAKAIDYRAVGRRQEAINFLNEAQLLAPTNRLITRELTHTHDAIRNNPALSPQHVGDVNEVNRLLTMGYAYFDLGKFDDAIKTFDAVLAIDPYNMAAQRGKTKAAEYQSRGSRVMHDATRTELLAEVDKQWDIDKNRDGEIPQVEVIPPASDLSLPNEQYLLADALQQINIPQINLDAATVADFVDVLNGQIRVAASRGLLGNTSFNIVENFGTQDSTAYQQLSAKRITLNLSNVSLQTVLDIATRQLGIQYDFVPAGIELTYSGADFGPLKTRQYTVHPAFFRQNGSAESEDDESDFGSTGSSPRLRRVSAKAHLEQLGIAFPAGANARYSAANRTLTVSNTSYNLKQLDELLAVPFQTDRQVMLNVYSMNVSQRDLEDLGFEWIINASISDAVYAAGGMVSSEASNTIGENTVNINAQGNLVTSGLRSGRSVLTNSSIEDLITAGSAVDFTAAQSEKSPGIFGFRGIWTGADLSILVRGLNQKKGVDSLYNPQVIFSPAEERQVLVANVREFFVPTSYTEPQLQQNSSSTDPLTDLLNRGYPLEEARALLEESGGGMSSTPIVIPSHPEEFEFVGTTEDQFNGIGTTLAVHRAQILNGGESIIVDLSASINEFDGFVNWGTPITAGMVAGDGEIYSIEATENRIVQPIFNRKFVNTSLELAPGNIVVFASLHEAKIIKYEDKVPILGDIPLLGRLFRSEGSSRDKRVLLFFARVDLMDPTGLDVKTGQRPALPGQ